MPSWERFQEKREEIGEVWIGAWERGGQKGRKIGKRSGKQGRLGEEALEEDGKLMYFLKSAIIFSNTRKEHFSWAGWILGSLKLTCKLNYSRRKLHLVKKKKKKAWGGVGHRTSHHCVGVYALLGEG